VERGNNERFDKFVGKGWNGDSTKGLIISTEKGGKGFNNSFDNFDGKRWKEEITKALISIDNFVDNVCK
jgi:hypothetical protein